MLLYILEINRDVLPVLENRTMTFSIHSTASGVSIPVKGLYFNGGVPFVFLNPGRAYQPIQVVIPASFRAVKRSMIRPAVGLLISFTLSSGLVEWTDT